MSRSEESPPNWRTILHEQLHELFSSLSSQNSSSSNSSINHVVYDRLFNVTSAVTETSLVLSILAYRAVRDIVSRSREGYRTARVASELNLMRPNNYLNKFVRLHISKRVVDALLSSRGNNNSSSTVSRATMEREVTDWIMHNILVHPVTTITAAIHPKATTPTAGVPTSIVSKY